MHEERTITKEGTRQALRDYWQQYLEHPFYALGALILPAIGTIFVFFIPPLIIAKIVNIIATGEGVSVEDTAVYVFLFAAIWLLGEALWRVGMHFLIQLETKGIHNLAMISFQRLIDREYDFYTNNFVGSLTKRAMAFSRGFEAFTDTLCFNVFANILPFIFAVVVLSRYSVWLPAMLGVASLIAIGITIPLVRRRAKLVALRHAAASKVSGDVSDVITNMVTVKSFAQESAELSSFREDVTDYTQKFKKASDFHNLRIELILSPFYVATNAAGLVAALYFVERFGLSAGALVVIFSYYGQVTRFFWEISRVYRTFESTISEAAEFAQMFLAPAKIADASNASPLQLKEADIVFSHANFSYPESREEEPFLKDFNLTIRAGQRVGLVGPSGGGKTTITKLLLRFLDLSSGSLMLGGQDLKGITQQSLREHIGYVPQEPLLFHRSLFENIAYAKTDATEEEVVRAAKLAHAHEFIEKLPLKYDTLVGERGVKLSGGQRQRVAIARAILKNAPVLVLDEATSALDSESERYIQEGLWELMKDKTAIVIAHRLSTIKHLDRIIVLDQGKIVQDGTHEELLAEPGLYARLWSHQSGGFIEE